MSFKQGHLDALCGVYSIINAIYLLDRRGLKPSDLKLLFDSMCDWLDQHSLLLSAVKDGINPPEIERLIDYCSGKINETKLTWCRPMKSGISIQKFHNEVKGHLDKHGPGSVILSMRGLRDHWSCVESISAKRFTLRDSSANGLAHLNLSNCTTVASTRHANRLIASETFFLTAQFE